MRSRWCLPVERPQSNPTIAWQFELKVESSREHDLYENQWIRNDQDEKLQWILHSAYSLYTPESHLRRTLSSHKLKWTFKRKHTAGQNQRFYNYLFILAHWRNDFNNWSFVRFFLGSNGNCSDLSRVNFRDAWGVCASQSNLSSHSRWSNIFGLTIASEHHPKTSNSLAMSEIGARLLKLSVIGRRWTAKDKMSSIPSPIRYQGLW